MKTKTEKTPSTVTNVTVSAPRTTRQTVHVLTFIHRFRHVTARHIQLSLGHSFINTTHSQLTLLSAKGYIARQYGLADRAANRAASYFLTPKGLSLLQAKYPKQRFRKVRSVRADATMGIRQRERYHTLADTYAHFKRHYGGHFEFFTTFDIANIDCMPDEIPDGYVRTTLPDSGTQHYFIEIYGWNRSTQVQQRRLHSYLQFAESERWQSMTHEPSPRLFIVATSQITQRRLGAQLANSLQECLADNFYVFTTIATKLDSENSDIWHEVGDRHL